MFIYLIIQLNLWQRSRENPIYGSLIPLGLVCGDLSRQQKTRTRRAGEGSGFTQLTDAQKDATIAHTIAPVSVSDSHKMFQPTY
jgi:hypothetical protein